MTQVAQLEETVAIERQYDPPKLLVEWSPRWEDFVTSIRPALARSTARLAGETPFGLRPYRNMFTVMAAEAFVIFAVIIIRAKVAELRPYVAPRIPAHDIIYYSGDELPRTEDLGGAQNGASGRAGGEQARHRTQTIKVARGGSLTPKIADAPNLKIPASRDAVANLLAVRSDPGPPPVEGLRSSRTSLNLPTKIVAPAPGVIRDYTRNAVTVGSVIPPSPSVSRDNQRSAPSLNSGVIAPSPEVSREHTLVAPALAPTIVAPAPNVARDRTRSSPAIGTGIIPPAPDAAGPEIARAPVQIANNIVPPPVCAPERESARTSKVSLPSPSVIAPPPSADISHDMRRISGGSATDPSHAVVPPPPNTSGSGSLVGSLLGKLFGSSEVVPPPPSVPSSNNQNGGHASLAPNVVTPPPSVTAGSDIRGNRGGAAAVAAKVVPPPPVVSGSGSGGNHPNATLLANNVVPPPPSVSSDAATSGSGRGANGTGLGRAMDIGSPVAPPANGGAGNGPAAIISTQPGPKVGKPNDSTSGALAMSPTGGDKPGIGSGNNGKSIGHGDGPGSGMTGSNSGAGNTGTGRGSTTSARGGISTNAGTGGAGNAASGNPPVPGVSVSGGTAQVTLPSFGDDPAGNSSTALPGHSPSRKPLQALDITVVATATSGGAFEAYKNWLPGGEKYTRYLDTSLGSVVMEFSDPASASHPHTTALTGPQPIRVDLPSGLPHARLVVACVLDASGNLKNLRVLESGPAEMNAKVLSALQSWKFQPAMIADKPVEVSAILGFNIDTNDRN